MIILALDTATPATTVAVIVHDEVRAESTLVDARRHCEILAVSISQVLASCRLGLSDIEHVVVGVGPGAFTGLRVGLATARALGDALTIPVHGLMTLDSLAFASGLDEPFTVVTDARRREVFWSTYTDRLHRDQGPTVSTPDMVTTAAAGRPVIGVAATPFAALFSDVRMPDLPAAGAVGQLAAMRLAAGENLLPAEPMYLRRPDTSEPSRRKPVLP